jgi:ABC-type multidrug transport system fused ATPase/permease subunit
VDRLALLRTLRLAGPGPVALLGCISLAKALLPAAAALAMAGLVAHIGSGAPLAGFVAVLALGHLADAFALPAGYLVKARIDGAHRAAVARLASGTPTVTALEDPDVQDLIRAAAADPDNWTEKSPGDGAIGVLTAAARWLGAVGAGAVLAAYAWWLVPMVVVPALAGRALHRRLHVRFAALWARGLRESRRYGAWKDAVMSPAEGKEQRVYGLGEWAVGRQERAIHVMMDPLWTLRRAGWAADWLTFAVMLLSLGTVYAIVARGVVAGHATVAVETAVLAAGFAVYVACMRTADALEIEASLPGVRALPRLRSALPQLPPSAVPTRKAGPPRVRFRGVRFTYPGATKPVLDGLNLTIEPGESLAIVGLNGAGKSTLIKLLAGLYQPDAGTITVDGADIGDLPAWRDRITVVFQDFVRYKLSAADNVALGHARRPPDPAGLAAAAAESGLDEVLDRLPDGWDTPLSRDRTGGVDLSGGQWQRVALARALYAVHAGAGLLVLDEPTAHLDVRSEAEVFDRLAGRRGDVSVVLISHRLATVRRSDRIVLLDGGRITESGSHAELMALGGRYAELFTIQAERFTQGYEDRLE